MKFHIITIFPDQLEQSLKYGVIGKALETNTIELNLIDPRKFSDNDYGSIDDKPYGGGPGMVMQCEPVLSSIEDFRIQGKKIIVKLDGIQDRNSAEDLKNKEILVSRIELPKLEKNTYYWNDLLDLPVLDKKGKQIGKVDSLFETGSNDVLVIVNENKERLLVPFIMEEVIKKVDLVKEFISIDWPEIE